MYIPLDFRLPYETIPFGIDIIMHRINDITKKLNIPELKEKIIL